MSEQRTALVTGASRGIGAAILAALGRAGFRVVGTATSEDGAAAIGERLAAAGWPGGGAVLDVSDGEQCRSALEQISAAHGAPLVLVNNAGITRDQLLLRMKDADWDAIMGTNLAGVFHLTKACLRPMIKARFGRIVVIGSVIGHIGNAGQANYAASKAGIEAFTRSVAREVGARGITANTVAPGFIATDMTRALPEASRDALLAQVPLGRLGSPEDVAAAVAYLVSDDAAYVTGHTLHVNGGLYMG